MQPAFALKRFARVVSKSTREKSSDRQHETKETEPQPYNPYLAGRREWDERYGELVARAKKSDRIAVICATAALLSITLAGALAFRRPDVIPIPMDPAGHYLSPGL